MSCIACARTVWVAFRVWPKSPKFEKKENEKSNQPRVHHLNKFENSHVKIAKSRYAESIEWSQIRNTSSVMQRKTSQRSGTEGNQKKKETPDRTTCEVESELIFSLRYWTLCAPARMHMIMSPWYGRRDLLCAIFHFAQINWNSESHIYFTACKWVGSKKCEASFPVCLCASTRVSVCVGPLAVPDFHPYTARTSC